MKELTEWDFDIPRDNRFEAWPLKEIRKGNAEMNYSFNADYREVAKRMQRHNSLKITSCSASIAFMAQLIKSYLKWPWC